MEGFDSMIALWGYDYLEGLTAFLEGWIQVQDISSSLVGQLLLQKRVISSLMYRCSWRKSLHSGRSAKTDRPGRSQGFNRTEGFPY